MTSNKHIATRDSNYHPAATAEYGIYCIIPVKKDSIVTINYALMPTIVSQRFSFVYAEGSEND
jgi:hypothetical protein